MTRLSKHASLRCAQRGKSWRFVDVLLDLADSDRHCGDNCRVFRASAGAIGKRPDMDRLKGYAIVWSDTTGEVVTVKPYRRNWRGRRYRRRWL